MWKVRHFSEPLLIHLIYYPDQFNMMPKSVIVQLERKQRSLLPSERIDQHPRSEEPHLSHQLLPPKATPVSKSTLTVMPIDTWIILAPIRSPAENASD